jgi:hypothetical protein
MSEEERWYISSLPLNAEQALNAVRNRFFIGRFLQPIFFAVSMLQCRTGCRHHHHN